MTTNEKIAYLWNLALERAIGAGHPAPFDYADVQVAHLRETTKERRERLLRAGLDAGIE